MKLNIVIILVLCFSINGIAQRLMISGRVLDAESNERLVFASIGIKGKALGTISNNQGEFDFYVPSEFRNEIIQISYLGYDNYEIPVWSVIEAKPFVFKLKRSSLVLPEIIVTDKLFGGEIMEIALSRIDTNFPSAPFLLEGFYRDLKKVGGTYFALLEAAVKIYDEGYKNPRNKFKLRENVALVEVRKSVGYNNRFTAYFDQHNLLEDLLLHNNIRYRQFDESKEFFKGLKRLPNTYYNDNEVYVVFQDTPYFLKIFIDTERYAILRVEYETADTNEILSRRRNMYSKFSGLRKLIDFKEYEGKMHLEYIEVTSYVSWYDQKTNELKFETELFQQLLVNNVNTKPDYRISTTEKMKRYGLQYQDREYNAEFWDNYNVIKDSPLDKKIVDDIYKNIEIKN